MQFVNLHLSRAGHVCTEPMSHLFTTNHNVWMRGDTWRDTAKRRLINLDQPARALLLYNIDINIRDISAKVPTASAIIYR